MTKKQIAHNSAASGSPGRIMLLVLVCFFFSGVSGLIYEILWTRMLVKIIGGAPFAISIVLTVFMAGLGIGSYIAGRVIDRIKQPIKLVRIYGILELLIGAYGLVLPLLLTAFLPIYAIIYNRLFNYFMLYNILTFVGCSILLCIPVICMGATLPILCRFYVTRLSHLGTHAGRLYGLNTIGAAFGALLCGFWLISHFGVPGTLVFAVLINGVIGLSCLLVGSKQKEYQPAVANTQQYQKTDIEIKRYPAVVIGALVIFAVSGFCAMSYEVIWTKLLGLIVGPTTYSFTIVLVTFITGLALGSMIFGWLGDKMKRPVWLLIFTQIAAGLLVLGISHVLGNSQLFFSKLLFTFKEHFAMLSISKAAILFIFMILPTLCLGATFPLVSKIYTQSILKVGRSIGVAYAINTIGAVLGSFCAGFVLIPQFGKENSLSLVIGLQLLTSLVIAAIIVLGSKEGVMRWFSVGVPAVAGLILCFYFPVWNHLVLSRGRYHRFERVGIDVRIYGWLDSLFQGSEILNKFERGKLVYYGDGIGGFTTVLKYPYPLGGVEYSLANSGKMDASSLGDMNTQTLLAHFPMLFHRDPKTVMVLGLASGITAGEVLHYPVERLDVLDINQQVVAASDFFIPWNNNVLSNSRTNLIIQDGRAHLQLTDRKYDVIISEPSNPWMAGLAALFTREFFTLGRDRLNEDGIFCQWIHVYQMDWPTFALIGRAFEKVFPNSILVSAGPQRITDDYLLVGFKGKDKLVLENAQQKMSYARQSKNMTLTDPNLLYRLIVSEDLRELFGPGPVNTDSRPRLEFAAPKLLYISDPAIAENIRSRGWLSPQTARIFQQVTADVNAQIDYAAYALSVLEPFRNMVDLSKVSPAQKEHFSKLMENYFTSHSMENDADIFGDNELKRRCSEIQIKLIEDKIDSMPDKALSYFYLGGLYHEKGMLDEAKANYFKSLQIDPAFAEAHYNIGVTLAWQGNFNEAIAQFTESLRINPGIAKAHNNLGGVLVRQGKVSEAVEHFTKALWLQPDLDDAHYNLGMVSSQQGKLDEAIKHFSESLRIKPNNVNARMHLGLALAQQNRTDEAIAQFRAALQLKPDFLEAHHNLGSALIQQGRIDEGIEQFNEAIRINPNSAETHFSLGMILMRQGKIDEAVTHFNEALRIKPDFAAAQKGLENALSLKKNRDKGQPGGQPGEVRVIEE